MGLHQYVIEVRDNDTGMEGFVKDPETGNPAIFPNGPMARGHVQGYHQQTQGLAELGVDVGNVYLTAKPLPRDPDSHSFKIGGEGLGL